MANKKETDERIIEAYRKEGSLKKAANALNMCPQSIHERLRKLGVPTPMKQRLWTDAEKKILENEYSSSADAGKLNELALRLGRSYGTLACKGSNMKLTNVTRKKIYNMRIPDEKEARRIFDQFKKSGLTLGRFCRKIGISDDTFHRHIRSRWPDEWEPVIESKHPKQTMYRIGRQFEYRVRDIFIKAGYAVMRAAGSKGQTDLIAVKINRLCFIQCKRGGTITSKEWTSFYELCVSIGAIPILAELPGAKGTVLWEITGKKDGTKRQQPRIVFTP